MALRYPIAVGEWHHCYNRGVDKRIIFETPVDYGRFLLLLYLCNGSEQIHISNFKDRTLEDFLADSSLDRGKPLVELGAYALMPNHFHCILQEIQRAGSPLSCNGYVPAIRCISISSATAPDHFSGPFKSKHIRDEAYLTMAVPYVLLNPAELFDHDWKNGTSVLPKIHQKLLKYPYSSMLDFIGTTRPENTIVGNELPKYFERKPTLDEMLANAKEYYLENVSILM
ncbi:MAG: hypothetical protein ACREGH_03155 [Minisyncoccia bacterium]